MGDDTMNPAQRPEVVEPTEVIEPELLARANAERDRLIDGAKVFMLVGDERQQVPMPLPAVFQQMFAILGDLDRRLMEVEANAKKSPIVTLN